MAACLPGVKISLLAGVGMLAAPGPMSATAVRHQHCRRSPAPAGEAQPHASIGPCEVGVGLGSLWPRLRHPRAASCQGLSQSYPVAHGR